MSRSLPLIFALAVLLECAPASRSQAFVPLWSTGEMKNSRGLAVTDSIADERNYCVATPGMYAFFLAAEENRGSAVAIFPSGGHAIGLVNNSGSTDLWTDLCEAWLDEFGFLPAPCFNP